VSFQVKLEGVEKVIAKASPKLWAGPLTTWFMGTGRATLRSAQRVAPIDTGRTVSSLQKGASGNIWELKKVRGIPLSLRIGTRVTERGFCYPRELDESSRYRYRGGRAAGRVHPRGRGIRAGLLRTRRLTKGWFSEAPRRTDYRRYLDKLAADIARNWGS